MNAAKLWECPYCGEQLDFKEYFEQGHQCIDPQAARDLFDIASQLITARNAYLNQKDETAKQLACTAYRDSFQALEAKILEIKGSH